ncbi:MAG: hypothetical protein LBO65_00920 [Spirochaetaceae bacterium]|nr:hypothetical protein [Spirochaetaceae bacterium]
MIKLKSPHGLRFLLLGLFPCVLFGALAEFARDVNGLEAYSAVIAGEETSDPGKTLLVSENPLFYGQMQGGNRTLFGRFWKQFLSLAVFALINLLGKIPIRPYYIHYYSPQEFFHILVVSLLLGGRAPPRSVY